MKSKTLSLIMSGILCLLTCEAIAIAQNEIPKQAGKDDIPPNQTEIVLSGSLLESNFGQNAAEAYYDENSVKVCFYQNFGFVNIMIMTESGSVIYDNTINTAVQTTCIIPISGFNTGTYTLILNDANDYAEGDFIKN